MTDALTTCNGCDAAPADPASPAGYCTDCERIARDPSSTIPLRTAAFIRGAAPRKRSLHLAQWSGVGQWFWVVTEGRMPNRREIARGTAPSIAECERQAQPYLENAR